MKVRDEGIHGAKFEARSDEELRFAGILARLRRGLQRAHDRRAHRHDATRAGIELVPGGFRDGVGFCVHVVATQVFFANRLKSAGTYMQGDSGDIDALPFNFRQ